MRTKKLFISILAGVLAAVLVLGLLAGIAPILAEAESVSELESQVERLEKEKKEADAKIAALRAQLSDNADELDAIAAQKSLIDQEIFLLYQQIDNINSQIQVYGLLVADKQEELDAAQTRLAKLNAQNKERIRAMEKNGAISYWSVLFKANSFIDMLDRLKTMHTIAKADAQRLKEMNEAADEVAAAKQSLLEQQAGLEVTRQELTANQEDLEKRRAEADQLLSDLIAKGEEFEQLIEQSEDAQDKLADDLAQAKDDYENAKYQQWLSTSETTKATKPTTAPTKPTTGGNSGGSGSTGNTVNGITWVTPCSYSALTSPFGNRWHPLTGKWKLHKGVDLAAPTGTPIYATRSGYVKTAAYEDGGAGYYVSLDHGDGYGSIYMHMTHYIVGYGDYVKAGQVIGYVGSTGGSTGPHLHFGISYKGTYVNPADYINF